MSGVVIDSGLSVLENGTLGHIAGEAPGIVTLDNVPGRAVVDLIRRSDNSWVRRSISADDGTYRFTGLPYDVQYNLIGRDLTDTWDDVIVGRVEPFRPLAFAGNAPGCVVGVPYLYVYSILGGEPPYAFTLTGALPDGLNLVETETTLQISGTATALAVNQTFEIVAEDVRGSTASIVDLVAVYPAGAHRYWRLNISAANNHCSVGEMEMAATAGGADQCVGGVAIESGHYPAGGGYTFDAVNAFDGVLNGITNCWASNSSSSGWLGYIFAEPTLVTEIRICPRTEGSQSPRNFTIESSDDGITWNVEATYTSQTSWSMGTLTAYAV